LDVNIYIKELLKELHAEGRAKKILQRKVPAMKELPLSKVYQLLGPGPVVLMVTARNGRAAALQPACHDHSCAAATGSRMGWTTQFRFASIECHLFKRTDRGTCSPPGTPAATAQPAGLR
jgi:hypothetical protein